ncbi:MAG TPA: YrrS family protein [Cerasibacillus sp.]|uniref:YrrS family protein n=1 Tax=Cerasibacillus sp. TaxID=2498711 RepID=UPI002F4298C0
MDDKKQYSRVDKYEKRRKNTKALTILSLIGSVLIVVLIAIWLFGGNDNQKEEPSMAESNNQQDQSDQEEDDSTQTNANSKEEDEADETEKESESEQESEESVELIVKEPVDPSDANVIEAYTANWKPVGTIQEGPHTTQFDKSSQDWKEMTEAMVVATDLPEENMIIHWLGRGGEQQAIGTISSKDNSQIYRVYLSWIDEEGWQPTKVEVLKEVNIP